MTIANDVRLHAELQDSVRYVTLVAPRGSVNYNLHQEGVSDLDFIVVYVPTAEKLLLEAPLKNYDVKIQGLDAVDVEYRLVDIRKLASLYTQSNLAGLDFLWKLSEGRDDVLIESEFSEYLALVSKNFSLMLYFKMRNYLFSHVNQLNTALSEYEKKGFNYKTWKRIVTGVFFLEFLLRVHSLDTILTYEECMAMTQDPSLEATEYTNHYNLYDIKFNVPTEDVEPFLDYAKELAIKCEALAQDIPRSNLAKTTVDGCVGRVNKALVSTIGKYVGGN